MDLSLVPTNDLIEALLTRYDHAIFMGLQVLSETNENKPVGPCRAARRWEGNRHTCMGLAMDLVEEMKVSLRADSEDITE